MSKSIISREGLYLGLGDSEGRTYIYSLAYLEKYGNHKKHEFPVKTIAFTSDSRYLISGTPEMQLARLKVDIPSSNYFNILIINNIWLILMYFFFQFFILESVTIVL